MEERRLAEHGLIDGPLKRDALGDIASQSSFLHSLSHALSDPDLTPSIPFLSSSYQTPSKTRPRARPSATSPKQTPRRLSSLPSTQRSRPTRPERSRRVSRQTSRSRQRDLPVDQPAETQTVPGRPRRPRWTMDRHRLRGRPRRGSESRAEGRRGGGRGRTRILGSESPRTRGRAISTSYQFPY